MSGKAASGSSDGEGSELSVKLNKLFATLWNPADGPSSNVSAALAITRKTGVSISSAYLWQLRTGARVNPTVQHLRAIAEFFGVAPSFLIDPGSDPKIDLHLQTLHVLRDKHVRDLAVRASGLTPQALTSLAAMADLARQIERLPPAASWVDSDR
ncbi:XRE family transcriptional regulator [Mycobacterium sp. 134]|uniref:helix-turn-helix domain-containing protein n=1 Tax=unclassified Mycobacterium TaxID=2642494 RepID=UPI0008023A53|nr:helix-turn-helix domain-containing protein [Mycobacterium sp. E802]OBG80314.1 XRE family transcriptional regulator [Mycobacterium sp. E802]